MSFFKADNGNTTIMCKMCSHEAIKTKEHVLTLLSCLYCYGLTNFTHCSEVFIAEFEQVNTELKQANVIQIL